METGGAPIFADDVLRVQDNGISNVINYYEAVRRLLPELLTWDGATQSKQFENGLIIAGCEYDNTDPANPVVSEGFILSGGEICYFPGGTYNTGLGAPGLLYLYKGAATGVNRTFNDGGNKEILISYGVVIETGQITANGIELNGSTAITPTDEVVVLQIGTSNPFNGEDYFSMQAGLKVAEVADQITESVFSGASNFTAGVSLGSTLPYMVSRVKKDGTTELRGSLLITAAAQAGADLKLCELGAFNVNSPNTIPVFGGPQNVNFEASQIGVNLLGDLRIKQPAGGWPGADYEVVINDIILGVTSLPTPYDYKNDFLNIT